MNGQANHLVRETILDFITCKCKKTSCKNNVCNCRKSKSPCSGLCECLLCENNEVNEDISDEYAKSKDSTDDDLMKVMQNIDVK